jgi:hypothetical protein
MLVFFLILLFLYKIYINLIIKIIKIKVVNASLP